MCRMTTGITNLGKSNALNLNMESDFKWNDSLTSIGEVLLKKSLVSQIRIFLWTICLILGMYKMWSSLPKI